ncbi:hypothetical protein CDAR_203511 [Caerostris darwini]|uniref:Uncharacterized protein n=1 Tax=Caerostris darwini TaxID=1538125 RepID=A0AAV4VHZ7_9ARAC|nr:hypothetical protein CDAR_203511 [Caerostris darwini]
MSLPPTGRIVIIHDQLCWINELLYLWGTLFASYSSLTIWIMELEKKFTRTFLQSPGVFDVDRFWYEVSEHHGFLFFNDIIDTIGNSLLLQCLGLKVICTAYSNKWFT